MEEKLVLPYKVLVQKLQDNDITHLQFIKSQETLDIDYCNWLIGSERKENEESAIDFLDFMDEEMMKGQTW